MLAKIHNWLPIWPTELLSFSSFVLFLDILIVAYALYKVLMFIRGTRGMQLLKGLVVLIFVSGVSNWLHLETVAWILDKLWASLFVAVPVVFQPELRRALEQLGRGRFLGRNFNQTRMPEKEAFLLIRNLVKATQELSRNHYGALIVLERQTGLKEYTERAVVIDGVVSAEFLVHIFVPKTPLHDGAVVVRGNRVVAAGCLLPFTDRLGLDKKLGTRHRAAIGITEITDAVALVVSEESGQISLAVEGRLQRNLDEKQLKTRLEELLQPEPPVSSFRGWKRGSGESKKERKD